MTSSHRQETHSARPSQSRQQAVNKSHRKKTTVKTSRPARKAENETSNGGLKYLKVTGCCQLLLGVLSVMFGIVSIILRTYLFMVASPIWCGLCFFIVAGFLGIATAGNKSPGLVIAYSVMSFLACGAGGLVAGFGAGAIATDNLLCSEDWYGNYYSMYGNYEYCYISHAARVAIDICLLVIGVLAFVVSIIGATLTCTFSCRATRQEQVVVDEYQSKPPATISSRSHQKAPFHSSGWPQQQRSVLDYPTDEEYWGWITEGHHRPPPQGRSQVSLPRGLHQPPLPPTPVESLYQPLMRVGQRNEERKNEIKHY